MENDIMNIMNDIKYGYLDINGNIHYVIDKDFESLYTLQSPGETLNNKVGVCWDQVELERYLFDKENIKFNTYFIVYHNSIKKSSAEPFRRQKRFVHIFVDSEYISAGYSVTITSDRRGKFVYNKNMKVHNIANR